MITFKDIKTEYKIQENTKTVVCIITTTNDVASKLEKYNLIDLRYPAFDICKYVGIAKCHPDDEWDEAFGKRLAEYRASCKRKSDVNNKIKDFIKRTSKNIDNLYDYGLMKEPHNPLEWSSIEKEEE